MLCHLGWTALAQCWLTAACTSWVQVILLPQPPEYLGLQVPATTLSYFFFFVFSVEAGFHNVGQAGLQTLASSDLPTLASQSARITGMSHCIRPKYISHTTESQRKTNFFL